jgi:hypothetical protein
VTEKTQIEFEENIINSNLEYKKEDDIRKWKLFRCFENNTKIEVEVGDKGRRTKNYIAYNVKKSDRTKSR